METVSSTIKSIFQSNTARLIMVMVLILVLLIPLSFVQSLITERANRKKEVIEEVSQKYGERVYFYGPIIKVPYKTVSESLQVNEITKVPTTVRTMETNYAYFFPDELKGTGNVQTKPLHRSIYNVSVYSAKLNFSGEFSTLDFSSENVSPENIQWNKASILIKTSNLKSIKNAVKINFNNSNYTFEPIRTSETNERIYEGLETQPIDLSAFATTAKKFAFEIEYEGSQQMMFIPIGKTTQISMQSNWADPSFTGYFLPDDKTKKITKKGFEATWNMSHINRAFGQQYFTTLPNLDAYSFGVNFVVPVDEYQKSERASKYGFLVIGLTFLIFYLIQTMSKINIHIFQYSMIGLALVMFYTLLISITEHSSFSLAYIIAGFSVIALIGWYSVSVLASKKFPMFIIASLTALYSFIFVIIQLENYALLVGSIGLFIILGLVMYFSKKIDWNN